MIDHKELRIGNLIFNHYGQIRIVDQISHNINNGHDIKPIPITEEWIRKLGFEHEGEAISRLKIDCDFGVITIPLKHPQTHCKYIHQFQNLYFALTGKELTTKKYE